jgi:hypothetical protein
MLNQWFYSHATWQVALAVCSVMVLVPLLGLFFFHRLVDWEARQHDTTMVGLSYALCGSIYAVLLAFVAVGTYETMDRTATIASDEANSLGGLAFDSAGLPPELGVRVRADVDKYIAIATLKEWPSQRAYRMAEGNYEEGWAQVRRINQDMVNFEPATPGQATVKAEMERVVNELFAARRARLLAATAHLPNAVWQMLIFGLALVAVYVYLFGPHSYRIHVAVTTLTMLSIGLVFTLVIALDYPFRGELSVGSEAFARVQEVANRVFAPAGDPPVAARQEARPGQPEK